MTEKTEEGPSPQDPPEPESASGRRPRRRRVLLAVLVVLAVAVLGVGLYAADQYQRAREYNAFLTSVEKAEDIKQSAFTRWDEVTEYYKMVMRTEGGYASAWKDYGDAAKTASVDLAVVQAALEQASFMPWHGAMDQARDDYLDHIDVWMTEYDDFIRKGNDPGHSFDNGAEIERTFAVARVSSSAALPTWFVGDLAVRQFREFVF